MKQPKMVLAGFVAALALATQSPLLLAKSSKVDNNETSRLEALTRFTKVIGIVERYYVDDITIEQIIEKSMNGLLTNLDAHSNYLNEKHFESLKIATDGEFGGLGITVGIKNGALTVIAPIEGTPADEAGLEAADIILKINNQSSLNMTIDEAVNIMRGKPGTKIELTIVRKGESKPLKVKIIRDVIKIDSVYAKTIGDDVLYLRITSFDKKVTSEVKKHLKKYITSKSKKGIIIDLRNNPGGLLDQAVNVVDLFVEKGVIVSQKGKNQKEQKVYKATSADTFANVPIVVLVNGGSASASEIVSGALQDHERAVIVGEKSFGKGSVQVIMPIDETDAIKLTIARYYLPNGRTIQAKGVTPDIIVKTGSIKTDDEDNYKIKESELKQHLEEELEKVDGKVKKSKQAKKKDALKRDKKVITKKQLNEDLQLRSGVDILKALIITSKRR